MSTPPLLQRPIPRRPFDTDDLTPTSPDDDSPPKRSRSAVSLTASTLFGIYGRAFTEEPSTPLATRNNSTTNLVSLEPAKPVPRPRYNPPSSPATLLTRSISLFALGLAYGVVVTHLHDRSPMLLSLPSDRWGGAYLAFWGLAGVALGCVLPWLDAGEAPPERKWDWSPAVRGIGAFVGIAYGIRRLPWQSTLQVSLALALVNPFLWFLVDRTRSGFLFAAVVGVAGTAVLMGANPAMVVGSGVERIACGTWIASVLFCSCVCFGNVGRKLARIE